MIILTILCLVIIIIYTTLKSGSISDDILLGDDQYKSFESIDK